MVATTNRETSLLLLYYFVASSCVFGDRIVWRRALTLRTIGTTTLLALFWIGWRIWTTHRYAAANSSESHCYINANIATLYFPLVWPQLAGIAAYTLPFLLLMRRKIRNCELRLWLYSLPLWFAFMFYYGLLIENRLFGELIPLFTCTALLLAEYHLTDTSAKLPDLPSAPATAP
jgi:hypothetical protein